MDESYQPDRDLAASAPSRIPAVARWKIISGARVFYEFPGRSVEIGWARDLQRGDDQRTLNVCVSREADQAAELPQECRDAIRSHGRTATNAVLEEDDVPWIIDITPAGLSYEYAPEEDEDETDEGDEDDE
jgi:hypothetical protein